jgi:multidrug efflux pump subunit AcrA (membrane-fusion protein)
MALIPIYQGDQGKIIVGEDKRTALGIKSQPAEVMELSKTIRVAGKIPSDNELYLAEQEYLSAYPLGGELVQSARLKLALFGFADNDINRLRRDGAPDRNLILPGPDRAWVLAQIFEPDLGLVKVGQKVKTVFAGYPGKSFAGVIRMIEPAVDPDTRSTKARIEITQPGIALNLEMFAQVEIEVPLTRSLAVPLGSVIDTGARRFVYVDLGDGRYEPREIKTGGETNEYVQVVAGLKPGERVVNEGNFVLDSQTTLTGGQSLLYGGASEAGK